MAKDLEISLLLDFYGDLLTQKQREVIELYYNEDLSLAEIAEHSHITRQGVRDSIKRAENQLAEYEDALRLKVRFDDIRGHVSKIERYLNEIVKENDKSINSAKVKQLADKIKNEISGIGI